MGSDRLADEALSGEREEKLNSKDLQGSAI